MDAPTLTTERLILRRILMQDWEPYAAMWADERVTRFIGGQPRSREVAWPKFGQGAGFWPLFGYGYWSVVDRDDVFLGVGGFAEHQRGLPELGGFPECGWTFVPDVWGKGIASEAVGAMVAWADANLSTETRCMIDNDNIASTKVATRNGYRLFTEFSDVAGPRQIFRRPSPSAAAHG